MLGARVNNYEIRSVIGEGGMGTVYLAEHDLIGRKAAVKVLRPELAVNKGLVSRFMNEARAANAIHHPNIIEIIDVGTLPNGGLPYMMMELLEGQSLAARIAAGPVPVGAAVRIVLEATDALSAAHAKGIVHRDLKPDNLFLVPDPQAPGGERLKVLDFGIAKLRGTLSRDSIETRTGSVLGTPPYMSPEQCRGATDEVDHRSDIYSLGIILYEMVCGEPPFTGTGFGDLLVAHMTTPPPPPRSRNPAIPEALEQVILKLLAKAPELRFESMDELAGALRELAGGGARVPARAAVPPAAAALRPAMAAQAPAPRPVRTHSAGGTRIQTVDRDPAPPHSSTTTFSAAAGESHSTLDVIRPRRTKLIVTGIGAVAVIGGLAAVVVAVVTGGAERRTAHRPRAAPQSSPGERQVAAGGAAAGERAVPSARPAAPPLPAQPASVPAPPDPARTSRAEAAAGHIVKIASVPAGADVWDEAAKRSLGHTPLELRIEAGGKGRRLSIKADGYLPKTVTVRGDAGADLSVVLVKRRAGPAVIAVPEDMRKL